MVPRSRNAMTTQTPQRSRERLQDLVRGPITALAAASPDGKLRFLGGARPALAVDARRVCKDVRGP